MRMHIPLFGNVELDVVEYTPDGRGAVTTPEAIQALEAFLALTPVDKAQITRHVYAYYSDTLIEADGEWGIEERMGTPSGDDIWDYVIPGPIHLGNDMEGSWYVTMVAECAWEEEHGLMLVWDSKGRLCKVSAYDGHHTNASARSGVEMSDIVYYANNDRFTTRRDV